MNPRHILDDLKQVATVALEFADHKALMAVGDKYEKLLADFPQLGTHPAYLDLLGATGGAHVHNSLFSLGLYGFGGYLVPSFDEGPFVDEDRYFIFGEVLYFGTGVEAVFAFDMQASSDLVYISPLSVPHYRCCCESFLQLLEAFVVGPYPQP
jgi:hypothetical protein